jgi:hypothetical protein
MRNSGQPGICLVGQSLEVEAGNEQDHDDEIRSLDQIQSRETVGATIVAVAFSAADRLVCAHSNKTTTVQYPFQRVSMYIILSCIGSGHSSENGIIGCGATAFDNREFGLGVAWREASLETIHTVRRYRVCAHYYGRLASL